MTMNEIRFRAAVPQFAVPDVVRTAEYYRDVLGFEIAGYWDGERVTEAPSTPPPVFVIVQRDDVHFHFSRAEGDEGRTAGADGSYAAYIHITGVDALAAELRARGAEILDEPEDRVYGQRELVIRDCNGLVLAFGERTTS
jgi:uncharacterized glyoxalase superfamily protein PhnB